MPGINIKITSFASALLVCLAAVQKVKGSPEAYDNWQADREQRARKDQQRRDAADRFARTAGEHLRDSRNSFSLGSDFGSSRDNSWKLTK